MTQELSSETLAEQLLFDFDIQPTFNDLDFFVTTTNYQAMSWIKNWPQWPGQVMSIYGPSGCGKTHLGKVWQKRALAQSITKESLLSPHTFETFLSHPVPAYILDDLEPPFPEEELFHFYNSVVGRGGYLLLLSRLPPAQWVLCLPDLRSRLKSVPAIGIDLPDDALLEAVLTKLFSDRQIRVSGDLINLITKKIDRSFDSAMTIVSVLDKLSLKNQKAITLPLLKETLAFLDQAKEPQEVLF
jgi:chromosomal replication initiation ATPase DnaA